MDLTTQGVGYCMVWVDTVKNGMSAEESGRMAVTGRRVIEARSGAVPLEQTVGGATRVGRLGRDTDGGACPLFPGARFLTVVDSVTLSPPIVLRFRRRTLPSVLR